MAHNPSSQETAIIRLIFEDMLITFRRMGAVAGARVMHLPIWINPKDKFRHAMCQVPDCCPPAAMTLSEEIEYPRGVFP